MFFLISQKVKPHFIRGHFNTLCIQHAFPLIKVSVLQQTWNLIRTSGAPGGGSGEEQNPHREPHLTEVP